MIQQLLNTSAIWLLCLLAYDIFLGRENYHCYNRLFLLGGLLCGIMLPMISWQAETLVYHTPFLKPIQEVSVVKQSIEKTVMPVNPGFNSGLLLLFIYAIGVSLSLVLVLKDILMLSSYFRNGKKHREQNWIIVQTAKAHGPFSVFNCLFINDRSNYSDEEWKVLLAHEKQHAIRLHFIDLLLMQIVKVAFWFHPLVYLFQQRLLLVHEYQADIIGTSRPKEYGSFLIDQALLQNAPVISHSFNRSPIKKRIIMLTKKPSKTRAIKALVAIPLAVCCVFMFTENSYSYKKDDGKNTITFRGNKFEFAFGGRQSGNTAIAVKDNKPLSKEIKITRNEDAPSGLTFDEAPDAAETTISVQAFAAPVKMNGNPIYSEGEEAIAPVFTGKDGSLTDYIFNNCASEFNNLSDGTYDIRISYPIIDEKGSIVYYENQGIIARDGNVKITPGMKQTIDKKVERLLDNSPKYKPALLNGIPVPYYEAWGFEMTAHVVVKDHLARLEHSQPFQLR